MPTVRIGPEFFANAKRDYSDWHWAWVRELAQNSIDAPGTRSIKVTITTRNGGATTTATWENDGRPMDEETLTTKFLALGASGKRCDNGAVGGFGKAKEVIAFAHLQWAVQTGHLLAAGEGGEYELSDGPPIPGTRTTVVMQGDQTAKLTAAVRKFAECCQWNGTLMLNGEKLTTTNPKGHNRGDFGWATIYTNNSFQNRVIVRIGGVPMFTRYLDCKKCVIVELAGTSLDKLAANRDSLTWQYQEKLDSFLVKLLVDKRSAFDSVKEPVYTHYEGERIRHDVKVEMEDLVAAAYDAVPQAVGNLDEDGTPILGADPAARFNDNSSPATPKHAKAKVKCTCNFVVRNTTGLDVPDHFLPQRFSSYSKRLLRLWVSCLLELHAVFGRSDEFSVGFIFDDECEAMHEKSDRYGRVYYINPATVVKQQASNSRSLRKRWKFTPAAKYAILSRALHEFVHYEVSAHNEDYSSRLTDLCGVAFANLSKLRRAF